ncbi:MAG: hypothetical protein U0793_27900 [Gemmataceae bacterium]
MLTMFRAVFVLSVAVLGTVVGGFTSGAAADDTAPLRYGWKKGEHYLYSVRIEVKSDGSPIVLTSLNNYGVVAADGKTFWLRQRNNLIAEKEDFEGKRTPVILQSGLTAAARTNDIRIDPFGQVLKSSGESQLPFVLGNLSMLAIIPLSPEGKATWEAKNDCVIKETVTSTPPPSKSKLKLKKTPPPATKTNDYPATETTVFTLGARSGDLVTINKKYVMRTRHEVGGKPYLEFEGEGPITFDAKAGVPRAMEFKGTLRTGGSKREILVSFKLLEGEEREKALHRPVVKAPEEKAPVGEGPKDKAVETPLVGSDKVEWTDDIARMRYPDAPAAGKVLGQGFRVDAAKLEVSGALTLSQGGGFFPDAAVIVFLKPGAAIEGKTFEIRKETPAPERPPVHLKRIPPGGKLPAGPAFVLGYALKLEFGTAKGGFIPGKIYLCCPDEGRSVVTGTFMLKQP